MLGFLWFESTGNPNYDYIEKRKGTKRKERKELKLVIQNINIIFIF
jgi:hypothetical protein